MLFATIFINLELVGFLAVIALLAIVVICSEFGFWQQAVAPKLVRKDLPTFITSRVKILQRKALADLLPYHRLIRPNVVKNGIDREALSFTAAWRIAATDVGTLDDGDIINTAYQIAATIGSMPPSAMVQMYARRAPFREYDRGLNVGLHPVLELLDDLRADFFLRQEKIYRTERTICLTWKPSSAQMDRLQATVMSGVDEAIRSENDILDEFEQLCTTFENSLTMRTTSLRRLGHRKTVNKFGTAYDESELLSFINGCVSGRHFPIAAPPPGTDLNEFLAVEVVGGEQPRIGDYETSVISIRSYPDEAVPLMLDRLTEAKISHVLHMSYEPQPVAVVQKELRTGIQDFKAAAEFNTRSYTDPHLDKQKSRMINALGKASDDFTRMGLTSFAVVLRARNRAQVKKAEAIIEQTLNDCLFRVSIRRAGALGAVLATMPGMTGYDTARKHLMDALTVAKMFPVHEAHLGRRYAESESLKQDVPAPVYSLNRGGSLFRQHMNVKDVFHKFTLGRSGVGKSVGETYESLMFLARMPDAGVTVIDRGPSAYQACKMLDGEYYKILGAGSPGFALFADAHIPSEAREIQQIIKHMLELSELTWNDDRQQSVADAVRILGTRPQEERSMLAFYEQIQGDPALRPALHKYTRLGSLGTTLDCSFDSFTVGRYNVIDVEDAMSLDPQLLLPILEVIAWKTRTAVEAMKERLGTPDLHWRFGIDECNNSLMRHKVGQLLINDILLMGRKRNYGLSLASNSVKGFVEYAGFNDILSSCQTRVYYSDSSALGANREFYERAELPERGIAMLPELRDREFILHQPEAGVMRAASYRIDRQLLAVMGTSRTAKRVDEYIDRFPVEKFGKHYWKFMLLTENGARDAADRLAGILRRREGDQIETDADHTQMKELLTA